MAFPDEMKKGSSLDPRLNTDVPPGSDGGHEGGGDGNDKNTQNVYLTNVDHQILSHQHGRNIGDKNPNASSHVKKSRTFRS